MQEVIPKDGQRFVGVGQSAAEVIFTGAALIPRSRVTRDTATGLYVARGIKATGTFHGPCAPGFPRCNYTQDLFLGDEPLLHVASRAALLHGPGQRWYFDFNSSAVWLAAARALTAVRSCRAHGRRSRSNHTLVGAVICVARTARRVCHT